MPTTTVPDIRLQKPATTVASIISSKRLPSICRPRIVLRMMMKGAAKARNGTAANVSGAASPLQQTKACRTQGQRLIAGGQHARERKADRQRKEGLNLLWSHRTRHVKTTANASQSPRGGATTSLINR